MTTAVGVDIIPGRLAGKRDFIGGQTEKITVLLVKLTFTLDQLAGEQTVNKWETRGSPELGARELGERVEVEVIDDLRDWILHGCQFNTARGARNT